MRITNKMMSGNSMANINTNKTYLDKLNNQMSTQKKLTRPSDDPIVAIRALRLRSSLSEVTQYYGANVPDAQAWVSVTESAIESTKDVLSSLKSYADQGANGTNTASDREKIYENINALKKQIYANGNASYAGRGVFTGYRTGESLTFSADTEAYYRDIKDTFNAADIGKQTYSEGEVTMDEINSLGTGNTSGVIGSDREQTVKEDSVYRVRLSYDDVELDESTTTLTYKEKLTGTQNPTLSIPDGGKDPVTGVISKIEVTGEDGKTHTLTATNGFTHENSPVTITGVGTVTVHNDGSMSFQTTDTTDGDGNPTRSVYNISADGRTITSFYKETDLEVDVTTSTTSFSGGDIYSYMKLDAAGDSANTSTASTIYLVKDTGELIMGSEIATKLSELPNITGTETISVKYDKTRFEDGDVKPEHYFDCTGYADGTAYADPSTASADEVVEYDSHEQSIYYTVGTNQKIQINTNAQDVFDTQIMREVDDILEAIETMNNVQAKVDKLSELSDSTDGSNDDVENLLKAANKELEQAKNKLQSTYEDAITQFGSFFDKANLAQTTCGTVENRLTLISNRLAEEKTSVTTLASENENVDITEVAVEVSQAELVYNAALMATGKISQHSLVDYI